MNFGKLISSATKSFNNGASRNADLMMRANQPRMFNTETAMRELERAKQAKNEIDYFTHDDVGFSNNIADRTGFNSFEIDLLRKFGIDKNLPDARARLNYAIKDSMQDQRMQEMYDFNH